MSEYQSGRILDSIRTAYLQQFGKNLDKRLLRFVVDKEIRKKREDFVQMQIAMAGVDLKGLEELQQYLQEQGIDALGDIVDPAEACADASNRKRPSMDVLQDSIRKRARQALAMSLEKADPDEYANLSEEERQKERQRAYARAYYHRKKQAQAEGKSHRSRSFKTTPEQRAYQRAYYRRKKQEKFHEHLSDSDNSGMNAVDHDHKEHLPPYQKPSAEAQNTNFLTREQKPASEVQKPSFDYATMMSDRLAVEDAFRADSRLNMEDASDSVLADAAFINKGAFPKTKLRKGRADLSP
ncbi:MAG: hypothetical protein H6618_03665 [Deltaproteobacteria bacterium]|nr:hypothetical protein [Deltaproteobacteria bacterium]